MKTADRKSTTSAQAAYDDDFDSDGGNFKDVAAERAVNAGILQHGRDAYIDAADFINTANFTLQSNQVMYKCFSDYYEEGNNGKLDWTTFLGIAKRNNLDHIVNTPESKKHLAALMKYRVEPDTVRREAAKLLKLSIGRNLYEKLSDARKSVKGITGDESLNHILSLAENPIFEYTSRLGSNDLDGPIQIAKDGDEWLEDILSNPRENIGIPTPFNTYNTWIGGGLRRKSISIIGARPKSGKTVTCDNIGMHVAGELGIPVLNMDTEMTQEEHLARILAHKTGIEINDIERGKVTKEEAKKLREVMKWLKSIPYYYESVIDRSFEEQMASMRRWCVKTVGYDENGKVKDALIIYDYLQLTDPGDFKGDFKEYQLLGFQMVALHRLAKRCDVPILSMLQLNRDGIDKESTAVAAGSDRIVWKCSSFSILKRKEEEEIAEDGGVEHGNIKLINLIARHGEGTKQGDYLNLIFTGKNAHLAEGKTRYELQKGRKTKTGKGFEITDHDPNQEFAI